LWRTNFNISAAVGYIAVFGVSVLNGVVLVSSIRQATADGSRCATRSSAVRDAVPAILVSAIVA
jgi:cobalt-zinc-cadmium resistance protein CzcA